MFSLVSRGPCPHCEQHPMFIGSLLLTLCPTTDNIVGISVFHSETAIFCVPSNPSGIGGLYQKTIQCTPWWKIGDIIAHQQDCVILNTGSDAPGMRGLDIMRSICFFLFEVGDEVFSCTLVHYFCKFFDDPDPNNSMWIIEPDFNASRYQVMLVIHVDSIVHGAHLLPVFRVDTTIPGEINFSHMLDVSTAFYVNKYIDYHTFETVF